MKRLNFKLLKIVSACLYITAVGIAQDLQNNTKSIVNGEEIWTFNEKKFISVFYEEEHEPQKIDPKNLFNKKQLFSKANTFDERWTLQLPYPTDAILLTTEADNDFIISAGVVFLSLSPPSIYSDLIISSDDGVNWNLQRFEQNSLVVTIDKYENYIWLGGYDTDYNGFLLKSTDLGTNWNTKLSADSFAVLYVNFFNENNGVVISENILSSSDIIKVYHTTDGGDTWTSHSSIWPYTLNGFYTIHFSNENFGWISDKYSDLSRIINTTDGGMNWQFQFEDTLDEFVMIHFSDTNHGWAAGERRDYTSWNSELKLYSSTNGGNDWIYQFAVENENSLSFGCNMSSLDSLNIWLAISNWPYLKVFRTTNGGIQWTEISQLDLIDFQLGEIEFVSETEGWITSALGMVYYTSDGGYSWIPKHKSVTLSNLEALDFIDSQTGWAAGNSNISGYNNNDLIKTEDGGDNWSVIYTDTVYSFIDIDFLSEQLGFGIFGEYQNYSVVSKTQDGGTTWDTIQISNVDLKSILFIDEDNGWAVGTTPNQELFITHTSNSGISWQEQNNINIPGWGLIDVDFIDSEYGFAVGNFGALIKTTDGGNSWTESWGNLDPNLFWSDYQLTGVYFPELLNCWVTGYSLYSGGYRTMVAHTTDGGANWDTLSFSSSYGAGDIFFINDSDGFIVGRSYDYKTTDGGDNWTQIDYPSEVLKMFFLDEAYGWAVGYNGRIFKYFDPNVGVVDDNYFVNPKSYALYQNYPNPFNPSTKIKYSIPPVGTQRAVSVQLKVYDILGKEVAILVNEEQGVGFYEIDFVAGQLSSGIYFYQLKAGDFIQTNKMLLLK